MVLLPMPGSPPSSVTDPATSPPPSTRSISGMPVGWGCEQCASTSPMGMAGAPADSRAGGAAPPSRSSTNEFHASQVRQRPAHFGVALPQSVQR